ncbi:MAG: GNAT family N-acetyltransferase [Pseudomonadota bacterium]
MRFIKPSMHFQESYNEYIQELGNEERYPFTMDFEYSDFHGLLQKLENFALGKDLPDGYVPSSTWWLVNEDNGLIGVSNLRHYLNQKLEYCGGHIGLGIRPSFRGQGWGKRLMQLSIEKLASMGLSKIHIHCYKNNLTSAKTITSNGGILDSEIQVEGKIVQRYMVQV